MQNWIHKIELLSDIAKVFPHEAYAAFVFGYRDKFTCLIWTVPDLSNNLKPLEYVIRQKFIKSILNDYECSGVEKKLFTLPGRHGGLSIYDPMAERCQIKFENYRLGTYITKTKLWQIDGKK